MGALTHTYCDYAAGNDYKGATFTDGAFTQATHTLTKVGAFAATKVNHWLYLVPNGGSSFTAGYFKVATVPNSDSVTLATDPSAGDLTDVKCTQHNGTTLPWRSVQGALDLITRDATNGDQVNVKAGTAQVNQAALTLATYGTPAEGAPLVIRGYTSAAGDGGIGNIDCGGFTMWAATNYPAIYLVELEIHSFGNNNGIVLTGATQGVFYKCNIHKGASAPSSKTLLSLTGGVTIISCYIHDAGTSGTGVNGTIWYSFVYNCATGVTGGSSIGNIIVDCDNPIVVSGDLYIVMKNSIYSSTARTGTAINGGNASGATRSTILNNVIEGYSGTGGKGIANTGDIGILGFNAFYNNATNESLADVIIDIGNDAVLSASPFTNPGSGDFSLSTSVVGAIDGAFPGAWYGPASTTDHADIGAVQNGAGVSNPPGWL